MTSSQSRYYVGVDIGGTFTDVVVSDAEGTTHRAKALTTHGDYTTGIMEALTKGAAAVGVTLGDLLRHAALFTNGTTIVTNAVAELKGLRVGLITTRGFRDTLRIARSARTNDYDMQTQVPLPDLVPRDAIAEVDERIDYAGRVAVALDPAQVRQTIRHLVEDLGCEAIAVCLLWSFKNPAHEQTVKALAREMYPAIYVTASSEIYPVAREYERMVTTVLNAFSGRDVAEYVATLEQALVGSGMQVPLGLMQSVGGIATAAEATARPVSLINSGPVGGVIGARSVGQQLGLQNIITADMGGTSFDTALIRDGHVGMAHRAELHGFFTGLSMVDISTVGAGGGSICWLDERMAPRVGPRSAGSMPGPACYGRGGTEPTVTDVVVALGLIDPDQFLNGQMRLDRDAAIRAIRTRIAEPLGWSVEEAAAGLYQIITNSMSDAVRAVSIEKGYDPREFNMLAYGGASPLFIGQICRHLGIRTVVIPANSPTFSAYGLLWSDYRRDYVQTVNWNLNRGDVSDINTVLTRLAAESDANIRAVGFRDEQIQIRREGDFRFAGQAFEITIPLPDRDLTDADRAAIARTFIETYERLYGEDTAWVGSEVVMLNCRVTAVGATAKPRLREWPVQSGSGTVPPARRRVYLPDTGTHAEIDSYLLRDLGPGAELAGPAILEGGDTTVYVPARSLLSMDPYGNLRLTLA